MSTVQINISDDLLNEIRMRAEHDKESIDQFLSRAIDEHMAAVRRFEYLRERGRKYGSRERFLDALSKAPDVPPIPGDEIE